MKKFGILILLWAPVLLLGARTWPPESTSSGGGVVDPATTTAAGIVELAVSREDAANVVVQGNDTRLDPFVGSGASHRTGLVPDPGASAGTDEFLREDGTWAVPTDLFDPGVELVDNTNDAFSIGEASNNYVNIDTLDGSEAVDIYKTMRVDTVAEHSSGNGITLDGLNLKDSGINATGLTTGTGYLALTDNLAAAWTTKEGSNTYSVYTTTNSSESFGIKVPLTTTHGISSGAARVVGGVHTASTVASTAILGTTETATVFDKNCALEAGALNRVGAYMTIDSMFLADNMGAGDNDTITFRAGSTSIGNSGTFGPSDEGPIYIRGFCVTRATGASGTVLCALSLVSSARGGTSPVSRAIASGSTTTSTTTLDLTAAQTFQFANTWAAGANDADSIRLDALICSITG